MSDSRLLVSNLALASTWSQTTGGTATGYALTNLNNDKRGLPWRSTTTNTHNVIVSTFTSALVKAVVLVNYAMNTGGKIQAAYWDGATYQTFGGGTGYFTIPSPNRTRLIALYDSTGVTTTRIRITFENTGAVTEYVELGVAFISTYIQPTQNVKTGISVNQVDRSVVTEALGGQESIWQQSSYTMASATYSPVSPTDRDLLRVAFDTVGRHTPVVFAIDPSSMDFTFYGTLPSQLAVSHVSNSASLWTVAVPFKEACS